LSGSFIACLARAAAVVGEAVWRSFARLLPASFRHATPGEAVEVFLAAEGIVVGSRPGPDPAADRLVAVEG
jgi:hypothetical protein